ncbi:uncharacterized protein LOC110897723 [Helianthus annuus]|uniref:uncharacterized protein LOC110897723 n=1 Tax=Helianthus annuus TaxID=4232 RepID=UPI000B8F6263|nr:uncharacterized protein LOC110897723 [Helianthus annuus]
MDRIPTVEALARRGMVVADSECCFCNSGPDSVSHLFSSCPFALSLWEKISLWCRVLNFFVLSFRDLVEIQNNGSRKESERKAVQGVIYTACWLLWKARNNLRFNGKRSSVEEIFSDVRKFSCLYWPAQFSGSCVSNKVLVKKKGTTNNATT